MAAIQRKQLEQLMGSSDKPLDLTSPNVCIPYCVEFCVHDLFANTKLNLGPCDRIHSELLRMKYASSGPIYAYEMEFRKQLLSVIKECDKRVRHGLRRPDLTEQEKEKLNELYQKYREDSETLHLLEDEIDLAAKSGRISNAVRELTALSEAQKASEESKAKLDARLNQLDPSSHQKLQPCRICGSFLSSLDSDARLANHFVGKLHQGYVQVRSSLKRIDDTFGG